MFRCFHNLQATSSVDDIAAAEAGDNATDAATDAADAATDAADVT